MRGLTGQQLFQSLAVEADYHLPIYYRHGRGHDPDLQQVGHGCGIIDDVPPLKGDPFLRKKLLGLLAKVSTIGLDVYQDSLGCHNSS